MTRGRFARPAPGLIVTAVPGLSARALDLDCGGARPPPGPPAGRARAPAPPPGRIRVAYVTGGTDPLSRVAAVGARDAARQNGVEVEVIMPRDAGDQRRQVEALLARGVEGIAINPID